MNEYVPLKTYTFPHEVFIDRSKLESYGIECFTKDEFTVQVHNFYSQALGGIRLQVQAKDVQRAEEILNDNPDLKATYEDSELKCPNCNSGNVTKIKLNRVRSIVALMVIGLPIPFLARKYQCYECHSEFKK